jgi:hypothetical protein
MKKLRVFAHKSEAQLAKSLLAAHGIRAEILLENCTLLVGEDDFATAKKMIEDVLAKDMMLVKPVERVDHFKKAVLFALGAPVLVPVVFNYFSLQHAYKFWENSNKETPDLLKVLLILILNSLTFFIIKFIFAMLGDMSSLLGLPSQGDEF